MRDASRAMRDERQHRRVGPLVAAGALLGIGLGGFVDGILLHQLLQWHHMLTARLPATDLVTLKVNMVWDGLFHVFTWLTTVAGLALLWRATGRPDVDRSAGAFGGSLVLGWGLFNVVEGMIDHELLQIHHVHPGDEQLSWDVAFLVLGAALIAGGWTAITRHAPHQRREDGG